MSYRKSEFSCVVTFRVPIDMREALTRYREQCWPDFTDSELLRSMLEKHLSDAGEPVAATE